MNQEQLHEEFEYRDGELYRKKASARSAIGDRAGWTTDCNGRDYRKVNFKGRTIYAHRAIFMMAHGYLPKFIDHINGDSLDNRLSNLREASASQNIANAKLSKANTSGRKGVYQRTGRDGWVAKIMVGRRPVWLGIHQDLEGAAAAYDEASRKYFGEFARNNGGSPVLQRVKQ